MYTHFNEIHYGNCILYGDSMMNPVEMCVHVLILKVLLLNGFEQSAHDNSYYLELNCDNGYIVMNGNHHM